LINKKIKQSCGIVLFRENESGREYLILQYNTFDHYWGLCKGTPEKNETEAETVLREAQEETGLIKIKLIFGFKEKSNYSFIENEEQVYKEVVWFLGEVSDKHEGTISHEHNDLLWLSYDETLNKITYQNDKVIIKKAESFLVN
jgi:bis(5'-nucleosidyl)-tetraphosphatase